MNTTAGNHSYIQVAEKTCVRFTSVLSVFNGNKGSSLQQFPFWGVNALAALWLLLSSVQVCVVYVLLAIFYKSFTNIFLENEEKKMYLKLSNSSDDKI